jgi:hypothetical protein
MRPHNSQQMLCHVLERIGNAHSLGDVDNRARRHELVPVGGHPEPGIQDDRASAALGKHAAPRK